MSPRPDPPTPSALDAAVERARRGEFDAAIDMIVQARSDSGAELPGPGAVAGAFAQVARDAEAAADRVAAETALEHALRVAPGYADLHFHRGCLMLASGRRPEARRSLEAALRINPRFVAARVEMALLDAREGLIGEALAALRTLGDQQRLEEPRAFQMGLKSLERADWEEAGALFKTALKLDDPRIGEALDRFHALRAEGEGARAAQTIREAVVAHPGYPDLHYLMGVAELDAGRVDDALVSLAHALELNPDFHNARIALARGLEALGDMGQATEQINLVLREVPEHAQAAALQQRWSRRGAARRGAGSGSKDS
jgi:tetratricopeptide (TPR) repeat protein